MSAETSLNAPRPAVGIACLRRNAAGEEEILLVRRGRAPRLGEWSVPGGKVEWGEPVAEACARELYEETGIKAEIGELLAVYEIIESAFHYVLIDYLARWTAGDPKAADDADEARFFTREAALTAVIRPDLKDVIERAFAATA
jgi:8-oxo-dGTP diphosphatase